jgi:hypothetical protein
MVDAGIAGEERFSRLQGEVEQDGLDSGSSLWSWKKKLEDASGRDDSTGREDFGVFVELAHDV